MKTNIGLLDRAIRIGLGALLIVLFATNVIGAWGLVGIVLVGTGLLRFCPAYRLFGIHTCARATRLP